MHIIVSTELGKIKKNRKEREHKKKSKIEFPKNYVVIDLETTGLDTTFDEIIEIGAIKYQENLEMDRFHTLVKPMNEIDSFISDLTGITNEMVSNAPSIKDVLPSFIDFLQDFIVVGHNVNFDINFIYDNLMLHYQKPFTNEFIDTLRLSRKLVNLENYRLKTILKYFKITNQDEHRAIGDCLATNDLLNKLEEECLNKYSSLDDFKNSFKVTKTKTDLSKISTNNTEFDKDNNIYNRTFVFTGVLEKMIRKEAAQLVVDLGGKCGNSVTKATNYLVLGNNDYCSSIKDGKSSKQKKAEKLKLENHDIEIITENVFYDMIEISE